MTQYILLSREVLIISHETKKREGIHNYILTEKNNKGLHRTDLNIKKQIEIKNSLRC